ncbi:hypothetical protein C5167_035904 [Papaver somniferum]|nr:hypothetical protein C5167_035904 [Papaver somniferum]
MEMKDVHGYELMDLVLAHKQLQFKLMLQLVAELDREELWWPSIHGYIEDYETNIKHGNCDKLQMVFAGDTEAERRVNAMGAVRNGLMLCK